MLSEQLELELEGIYKHGPGQMRVQAELMVNQLDRDGRLDQTHIPLIGLFYRLADALELSGGRGASVAMLAAQYQEVWERLASLPVPVADDAEEEFEVTWLDAAEPEPAADAG